MQVHASCYSPIMVLLYSLGPCFIFWNPSNEPGSPRQIFWQWVVGGARTVSFKRICAVPSQEAAAWDFRRGWKSQVS
jgi:hypothetical protein